MPVIAVLGTLDTKAGEVGYVAQEIRRLGHEPLLVDVGTGGPPGIAPHISREEVACAAGIDLAGLAWPARPWRVCGRHGGGCGRLGPASGPGRPHRRHLGPGRRRRHGHRHGGHARAADRFSQADVLDLGDAAIRRPTSAVATSSCSPASSTCPG